MPRVAPVITLNSVTDTMLRHLIRSPSTPQGLALRGRIVLAASVGQSNQQIAATLRIPEVTAGKWRRAFAASGIDGLQDAPRAGRPPIHGPEVWERIQARACQQPEAYSRWTVRTLARDLKLPSATVHDVLVASALQPHRIRTFTFSPDPDFEAKLLDIVGLYLHPPENALILCVDEKSGIQALNRTQPGLPLRARRPRTWTNEYVRHGTQALLAALEVATGRVIGHVKDRRTSLNFLRFMDEVVAAFPHRDLHVVLDNLKHSQERRGPTVAHASSPGPLSLHADACVVGQSHRGVFQHPGQTRTLPARRPLEGVASNISPAVPRPVQPDECPVHVDQRAREAPAHHRSHEGGAPQWTTPQAAAETCASSSRE